MDRDQPGPCFDVKEYTDAEHQAFIKQLQRDTLSAFGLKPWNVGLSPVPLYVRIWRKLTFSRRRVKWMRAADKIHCLLGDPKD